MRALRLDEALEHAVVAEFDPFAVPLPERGGTGFRDGEQLPGRGGAPQGSPEESGSDEKKAAHVPYGR